MLKKQYKFDKIFNKSNSIFLFILLVISLVNMLIVKDNVQLKFNYNIMYLTTIIYTFIIFLFMNIYYNKKSNNQNKILNKILLCIFIIIQLIYAISIRRRIGFDCAVIYGSAVDLINGSFTNVEYFSMYGNNVFLLLTYEILFRIINLFGLEYYIISQIILNVVIIDISILYIYKTCKIIFGAKYSKICNFLSIPMLAMTPYISVPYSDMISLIFPIGVFYNYLCIRKLNGNNICINKRFVYMTTLIIIGYLIKPTNIIIVISIIIYEIINLIQNIVVNKENVYKTFKSEYKSI